MNFRKSFEITKDRVEKISAFYKARNVKMEASLPNYYRFSRGSTWFAPLARDIRGLPTRIEVVLEETEGKTVRVLVLYDVDDMGKFVHVSHREMIMKELAQLVREVTEG